MSFEELVRERAYHIWIADGMAHGHAHDHWVCAEQALRGESASAEPVVIIEAAAKPRKAAAAKPVKAAAAKEPKAAKTIATKKIATKPAAKPTTKPKAAKSGMVQATTH